MTAIVAARPFSSLGFIGTSGALSWRAYVFLVLLSLALFLPGFTSIPPTDRDESRFAQATKQMVETSDYVDIKFQEETRYKKPVGIYWLQTAAVKAYDGVTGTPVNATPIWVYRIPSLLGAVFSVLLTALIGARLFGATTGLLAAVMLAGCVLLNVEARLAKTDAMLLASVLLAQMALARSYVEKAATGIGNALLFWVALGVGVLIKGPIIVLVSLGTILTLWIMDRKAPLEAIKRLRPLAGLLVLLAMVAPWLIAITMKSNGTFFNQSVGEDLLTKVGHGQGWGLIPPGYHTLVFFFGFWPFALLLALALPWAWRQRTMPEVRFCLAWILPVWAVFELILTKLPHYVLPAYPALALLAARAALDLFAHPSKAKRHWGVSAVMVFWGVTVIALVVALSALPLLVDHAFSVAQNMAGAAALLAAALGFLSMQRGKVQQAVLAFSLGGMVFFMVAFGDTLPNLSTPWLSRDIAADVVKHRPCEDSVLAAAGYGEPSLVFLVGTKTMLVGEGELAAKHLIDDRCGLALVSDKQEASFRDALQQAGAHPLKLSGFQGLDMGRGRPVTLSLYRLTEEYP